jgi:hypothetical protein
MSVQKKIGLVVMLVLFIGAIRLLAHAQARPAPMTAPRQLPPLATPAPDLQAPAVIAGNDIGFRVESHTGNTPVGRLVVRINGQWVEAQFSIVAKRVTAQ